MKKTPVIIISPSEDGELNAFIGDSHTILVPPSVDIVQVEATDGRMTSTVVYQLPKNWRKPARFGDGGPDSLRGMGWKKKIGTTGLIENLEAIVNGSEEDVRNFILKWGPLWTCSTHTNREHSKHCFWRFRSYAENHPFTEIRCEWAAMEAVEDFRFRAREIWAAFEITSHLLNDEPAPDEYIKMLPIKTDVIIDSVSVQRSIVASSLTWYLSLAGGPNIEVKWRGDKGRAKISINTGLGFFRAAWMQIAQLITGVKSIYWCSGCGEPYMPQSRNPPSGKNRYCIKCGKKAAKRDWARRNSKKKL